MCERPQTAEEEVKGARRRIRKAEQRHREMVVKLAEARRERDAWKANMEKAAELFDELSTGYLARAEAAEADADRLAESLREMTGDTYAFPGSGLKAHRALANHDKCKPDTTGGRDG